MRSTYLHYNGYQNISNLDARFRMSFDMAKLSNSKFASSNFGIDSKHRRMLVFVWSEKLVWLRTIESNLQYYVSSFLEKEVLIINYPQRDCHCTWRWVVSCRVGCVIRWGRVTSRSHLTWLVHYTGKHVGVAEKFPFEDSLWLSTPENTIYFLLVKENNEIHNQLTLLRTMSPSSWTAKHCEPREVF